MLHFGQSTHPSWGPNSQASHWLGWGVRTPIREDEGKKRVYCLLPTSAKMQYTVFSFAHRLRWCPSTDCIGEDRGNSYVWARSGKSQNTSSSCPQIPCPKPAIGLVWGTWTPRTRKSKDCVLQFAHGSEKAAQRLFPNLPDGVPTNCIKEVRKKMVCWFLPRAVPSGLGNGGVLFSVLQTRNI